MIALTRLNHERFVVNTDLIVLIEANPDTVLALTTGERVRVLESLDEVVAKSIEFKREVARGGLRVSHGRE
ncbi:flagellar FlbD family protein [Bryobacter aggregatus]|uniref:flagellar FlbD family protein n=1 Tax=Bryobacter aggregatus TaxID=360054 RepID=UPI0004E0C189|nr:flagellar FlbD family protein [Bryobacter aggregatus]